MAKIKTECQKCEGNGIILDYLHYMNGVCFSCGGEGSKFVYVEDPPKKWSGIVNGIPVILATEGRFIKVISGRTQFSMLKAEWDQCRARAIRKVQGSNPRLVAEVEKGFQDILDKRAESRQAVGA